jgi:hypothetical protein
MLFSPNDPWLRPGRGLLVVFLRARAFPALFRCGKLAVA